MGKKRIITKAGDAETQAVHKESRGSKKKVAKGILSVQSTYNNTLITLADTNGNTLSWSSSGSLGFRGAKKGTPFAASKAAEVVADRAQTYGLREIEVKISGVGAGRESALRVFAARGIEVSAIRDVTPVPHNGPRPKKPRRV